VLAGRLVTVSVKEIDEPGRDAMAQTVIHQPRVAWDGARAFVRAAAGRQYDGFADEVLGRLGPEIHDELAGTRERVLSASIKAPGDRYATDVEAGRWRVKLEDLLRTRPDLLDEVLRLTGMAPPY
jgi:hypothetical protein